MNTIAGLKQRWAQLQAREQKIILGGALALALILLYFLAFDPWLTARRKLERDLPRLRAELSQMRALAETANRLSANRRTAVGDSASVAAALRNELGQAKLVAEAPPVRDDGQGRLILTLPAVDADALLLWLEQAQKRHALRLASAKLQKLDAPGQVKADLVFELPGKS